MRLSAPRLLALLISLSLCMPSRSNGKEYGEYVPPPAGFCSRILGKVKRPSPQTMLKIYAGAIVAALVGLVGFAWYIDGSEKSLRRSLTTRIEAYAIGNAPILDPGLREKESDEAAHTILDLGYRHNWTYRNVDQLLWTLRKHAILWHTARGDERLGSRWTKEKLARELLPPAINEKLQTSEPMSIQEALSLDNSNGYASLTPETIPVLRGDARRVLSYPATQPERSEAYRKLVSEVLTEIDARAKKTCTGEGAAFIREVFGKDTHARYLNYLEQRFNMYHGPEDDAADTYARALQNAQPGQTVAQALEAAGISLFVFEPNTVTGFMAQDEEEP